MFFFLSFFLICVFSNGFGFPRKKFVAVPARAFDTGTVQARNAAVSDTMIDIVHEDEHVIAICKPTGMISMPCESASTGTAAHLAAAYLSSSSSSTPPVDPNEVISHGVVHRLDKEVSGLLLLAKNKIVSKKLSTIFSQRSINKTYIAIVHGDFKGPANLSTSAQILLKWPLLRRSSGKCGIAETPAEMLKSKDALTTVNVLVSNSTYSLLEVTIDTGRFHQIRAHLAYAGYPIVGDREYSCFSTRTNSGAYLSTYSPSSSGGRKHGGRSPAFHRTMLHSFSMSLAHPINGHNLNLRCPLPSDMSGLAKGIIDTGKADQLHWLFKV